MSDEPSHPSQADQPLVLSRRRSRVSGVLTFVALAVIAGGLAFLWFSYGDLVKSALFPTLSGSSAVASGEQPVTAKDFETLKQQTAASLQSMTGDMDAQKDELKKLSDQVAALMARIDALQAANSPAPAQTATVSAQPVVPPRPAVVAARKKPAAAKPAARISVGGAPLPPGPDQNR